MGRVADLGCIVCINQGNPDTPATVHHIRTGTGMARRDHYRVLPLCPAHHQHGGYGVAYHAGPATWEANFGTELELLEQVRELLA